LRNFSTYRLRLPLPHSTYRALLNGALALLVVLLGACCSTQRTSTAETRNEVVTEPHGSAQVVVEPLPATFDCGAPPPLTPCCRAMLPRCTECADRNRALEEAYRAQCGPR